MGKGKSSSSSWGSGPGALLGAGFLSSGAGSGFICTDKDTGLACTIKKTVSAVQGILFLCLILFLIYYVFINRKTLFK